MNIGVLGLNYKSSDIALRESFTRVAIEFYEKKKSIPCVLLTTCNRTEVYFSGNDLQEIHRFLLSALQVDRTLHALSYSYFGGACFAHLARVTTGIDSALFGETEVQGQVKRAYEAALQTKILSAELHYLFQKNLKIGKAIRGECILQGDRISFERILWEMVISFFPEKKIPSVLFVGYSETNRKIMTYFHNKGLFQASLATRSSSIKEEEKKKYGVVVVPWEERALWTQFDVVIVASKSDSYLLQSPLVGQDVSTRLLIDVSLPRNIDPKLSNYPGVSLFNIEDIHDIIYKKSTISFDKRQLIEQRVQQEADKLIAIFSAKQQQANRYAGVLLERCVRS